MTLSAAGASPDGDRRRDLRDRIGLVVGAGLAIAALVGSVLVMLRDGAGFVFDAAAGSEASPSTRLLSTTTTSAPPPGPDDAAAAPDALARTPGTAPTMTISMVSVPVPGPAALAPTASEGTDGTDAGGGAGSGSGSGGGAEPGYGSVQVGTTPKAPAPTVPPATPAPTEAPPPPTAPPSAPAPPPPPPPPPTVPPTAPPTTEASGPQLSSSLACQPSAVDLRLDMFTGSGGEIRRVRITGFNTPACSEVHFTLRFLDGGGSLLMSTSGTLKPPGPVSQTAYIDAAGLGGHGVKPHKVKKVEIKP